MAIRHSITLSTLEPNNEVGNLKIRQGDEQTQTLVANITENGVPKPFTGLQPFFCAKLGQTAGLGIIEQKVTGPMNPANGTLEYVMQPEDWQQLGRQTAYFSFRKMVNDHEWTEQFSTRDFNYNVTKSVFSEGLREVKKDGSTYVWTIEDMLRLFKEYIATGKIDWENYKNDERTIWEKFVEDNREFLETADPGGKIILELLGGRGEFDSLGERLDEEKAQVSAQLAQNESNVLFKKSNAFDKVIYPTIVQDHLLPINIYNNRGKFTTDFNPKSLKPSRTSIYYVNPAYGSDSNDGITKLTPFKTIKKALEMTGDNEIRLSPGKYYYLDGWQGYDPQKSISVVCNEGKAELTNSAYPRIWTEDPTYPGLYSTPTLYNGENLQAYGPDLRFIVKGYDLRESFGTQLAVNSVSGLEGGGTGFIVGISSTKVRLPNNLNPNNFLDIKHKSQNVVCKVNDLTDSIIYLENIMAEYGDLNSIQLETSSNNSKIILINTEGHISRIGDGIYLDGNGLAILQGCKANNNFRDGINYYVNSSVSGSTIFDVIEIECEGKFNGKEDSGTNNGTTLHSTARAIRLNGNYDNNQDRNVHDVGGGWSFNVGCRARFSQNNLEDFSSGIDSLSVIQRMWLVGCDAGVISAQNNSVVYKETGALFSNEFGTGTTEGTIQEFNPY